jgi:nucleotide-binding universal stress UspA family protein
MKPIINFERILCPVAQSHETDEGLHYAIALARSYSAKLFVLTCRDELPIDAGESEEAMRVSIKRAMEHSFIRFPGMADHIDWELVVLRSTRPSDSIKREAENKNVDLIVMSSHRQPSAAVLLGSTAEAISRTAPCPVLVTRGGQLDHRSAIGSSDFKKLLVASDFSRDSELALRYGLSLAQENQSELHLLHVMSASKSESGEIAWTAQTEEGPYHMAARRLHESVPAEVHLWCQVTHTVRAGTPYREIVSYAVEHEIDLICIGANGQGSKLGTLFGSNTERVLRRSPCPVLVTRPLRFAEKGSPQAER